MFAVHDVTVSFGDLLALDEVSLDAAPGAVTTIVGGDGAGKSTLLKVLAGRVRPDSGTVSAASSGELGMLPATAGSWGNLTVRQNLEFSATAFGLQRSRLRERTEELITAAGLEPARDRLASALSGGMRRKLGVIMALVGSPQLVLLDEPSTGVDPVSRVELWRLISRAAADGAAVITTTTYLDEAERASRFLALESGRALLGGTPAAVKASAQGAFWAAKERQGALAWRRGRWWHHWAPVLPADATRQQPDLHDLVVAAALRAEEHSR
ncbi:ABC transporter ATP-binding protein [Brooklawnia sp.]|uniref:ABC transporter ATP-binding protein n=1 Tax=Brooklawnia sp. TaxID=2699740 RepID=UPI00311EB5E0